MSVSMKSPVTELLESLCDECWRVALESSKRADRGKNAALMGFGYALTLALAEPDLMQQVASHLGLSADIVFRDHKKVLKEFLEALNEADAAETLDSLHV